MMKSNMDGNFYVQMEPFSIKGLLIIRILYDVRYTKTMYVIAYELIGLYGLMFMVALNTLPNDIRSSCNIRSSVPVCH